MDLSDLSSSISFRKRYLAIFILLLVAGLSFAIYGDEDTEASTNTVKLSAFPVTIPTMGWGFALDTLQVAEGLIQNGQSLSDLLMAENVTAEARLQLIENAAAVFDLTSMRADKPWIQLSVDSTQETNYLVYEPSVYSYIIFDLQNENRVWKTERPISREIRSAGAIIEGSLWNAMVDRGYSYGLTTKMEDALQWTVDFHHLKKEDEFRLIYEQELIEGEPVSVGNVIAAQYLSGDSTYYSVYFDHEDKEVAGYYNEDGKPMNAGFLKAPVKYSRISSGFNPYRLHPVLRYRRPHYGTDYAAPYGTPIMAVANGVVTKAERRGGNGNYVKIRHNETYETQYLHMQKFAAGIKPGVSVRQGQTIGYVGSTGLATGPHVCFRFWQNGKQVDHRKLSFPPAKALPDSLLTAFLQVRDEYLPQLEAIQPMPIVPEVTDCTEEEQEQSVEVTTVQPATEPNTTETTAVAGPVQDDLL
ncbi:MAG: peptidoglycan DD-metalloendopeptidase family protein [Bacteroidota bacterium]